MTNTLASRAELLVLLPPRYCPLPVSTHPDAELLEHRGALWLERYGLAGPRLYANDCAGFYGRMMPDAVTDRIQLPVDWCFLMFAFDDINCDEAPDSAGRQFVDLATRVLRVIEAPTSELDPRADVFLAPVRDLALRARDIATPTQIRRLVDGHRAWYLGVMWEFSWRGMGRTPSLNDYAHMRQHTAGGLATTSWIEIVNGVEIPSEEYDSPAVRALSELAFTIAAWDDDLFSYGKDQWFARRQATPSECKLNLLDVLMAERGHDLNAALRDGLDLVNRMTYRFIELRDQVLPTASEALRDFLGTLSRLLRGNMEWGLRAQRYRNPDGLSPDAVRTEGSWTDIPPTRTDVPPPIPSIAWCWHDLTP
jgi:Terpene synthase family 2, C-terminal metal binding